MNYNVGGISRSAPEWAATLGVSEEAVNYELRCGRTMQEVVHLFQTDTFAARSPVPTSSVAVPSRPQLATFASGVRVPGIKGTLFTVTGSCRGCMAIVRDEYEAMHKAHMQAEEDERRAEIRAGKRAEG